MSERKLILPSEVKVCATCTYWDGERKIDPEVGVVVVAESCHGECLVTEKEMHALVGYKDLCDCLWEDLKPDEEASVEIPLEGDKPKS
jgi:hypothetical protein